LGIRNSLIQNYNPPSLRADIGAFPQSQFFVVSKNNWWELLKDAKE